VTSRSLGKRAVALLATLGLVGALFGALVVPVASASTVRGDLTCGGSQASPGILGSGTYKSVTVTGFCLVPPGSTIMIRGGLNVTSGGFLVASGALDGAAPVCDRSITIRDGVNVRPGGSLILGDGEGSGCVPNTHTVVNGGLRASGALDLIIHGVTVDGGLVSIGGGDHGPCDFSAPTGPTYLAVEDSHVNGGAFVAGYSACWLGFARNHINGGVALLNNTLDDPDAMEILSNAIHGRLACFGNSPKPTNVADSVLLEPNTVTGQETGQCVGL
jgi:hypothetical protein